MNKNAAIIEGDTTKKFNPVSKVKVSNSDTGESTWIPEDSKETHSLSVIKNGIYYAASEGLTAYDSVTVNVSSETEVNYEGIIADMPDLADLGLYDLDDLEGLDGLDLDLDELEDLENLLLDGDLAEGELPESGATIKGIDPDSGETLEVGLDEDGNLMEQVLPDNIHIVVPPRKRHYQEGEIIDFSGIHVYLRDANNHLFTCEQYPRGEIPFEELIFPETVADGSNSHIYSKDGITAMMFRYSLKTITSYISGDTEPYYKWVCLPAIGTIPSGEDAYYYDNSGGGENAVIMLTKYEGEVYGALISGNAPEYYLCIKETETGGEHGEYRGWGATSGRISSNTFEGYIPWDEYSNYVPESTVSPRGKDPLALEPVDQGIPVQWMRSDGEILEDTFTITIGEGEDEEQEDPYAGDYDFIWHGRKYNINRRKVPEIHYANGYVWQEGISTEFSVEQAEDLNLVIYLGV